MEKSNGSLTYSREGKLFLHAAVEERASALGDLGATVLSGVGGGAVPGNRKLSEVRELCCADGSCLNIAKLQILVLA